jgi:hypothetical protein
MLRLLWQVSTTLVFHSLLKFNLAQNIEKKAEPKLSSSLRNE